jgi:hypothetical protein
LILESLYCPLLYGDLIVEAELDLGDHSETQASFVGG